MVGTCEACREHISVAVKRIKCTQCNNMFHSECVRFTGDSTSSRTQWKCPNCVAIARKGGDNSNTPIRVDKSSKIARSTRTDSADPTISICDDTRATTAANSMLIGRFESILDAKLKTIKDEIVEELKSTVFTELKNEIVSLSSKLSQLQVAQNHLQSENDQLKSDLCTLQARVTFSEDQLSDLRSQFGRQQQQGRINNLEIVGLPQMTSESPTDLVLKIAEYAGVELKPDDIEFAHRIQPQRPTAGRPKPIVVKMRDRIESRDVARCSAGHLQVPDGGPQPGHVGRLLGRRVPRRQQLVPHVPQLVQLAVGGRHSLPQRSDLLVETGHHAHNLQLGERVVGRQPQRTVVCVQRGRLPSAPLQALLQRQPLLVREERSMEDKL
ncbi:unnamed protein product [Leptidea sinapis]|uniref:PHD-type domain-containing protein n=1 Tax=Leptidea sinapis TaxID=189913 RepID=A0A5E4PLN0_9NEOP|nr:unnamed protein product [Leptidea sinapis]